MDIDSLGDILAMFWMSLKMQLMALGGTSRDEALVAR
jgi:hypothetical protein